MMNTFYNMFKKVDRSAPERDVCGSEHLYDDIDDFDAQNYDALDVPQELANEFSVHFKVKYLKKNCKCAGCGDKSCHACKSKHSQKHKESAND